jgi:hypothetical protein
MPNVIFAIEAAAADLAGRTIGGIAVPWNVPGRVSSGETVIFHPGSLDAGARPVALRDHDRSRVVGRVEMAADTGAQMTASTRISRTPLGDETLTLAADGDLMFSVGADPTRYDYDEQGRLHVYAAEWNELTLLPLGAYAGAVVTQVAAAQPEGETMPATPTLTDAPDVDEPDQPELPDTDEPADPDVPEVETRQQPALVPVTAGRAAGRRTNGRDRYANIGLRQLAGIIAASRGADHALRDAVLAAQGPLARGIEAALANVTIVGTDNVAANFRPAYQAELIDIIAWGTPTIDVLRQGDLERGDYPNKTFNAWTKAPTVALQATEKTAINSTAVAITPSAVPVKTWAGGNDISQQELDFGSPSFVDDYVRAAGIDYANKSNAYAVTTLLAAATAVTTLAGDTFLGVVQKLFAGLTPATTPPGGLFLAVSYDVFVGMIGITEQNGPAFWDGAVSFGRMTPEMTNSAGLTVYCEPALAARTYLAGHKQGATWYDVPGTPFTLRAIDVGLLGLDIAVYGYGALGIQYPGAFAKTTQP